MKAHILGAIKTSWTMVFVLFGIIYVARYLYSDLDHIGPSLHFSPASLAVTLVLHSGFWLFSSLYWKYLIRILTKGDISVTQSFSQFVLLSIGKYLPGKVWGMIARGAQLKRMGINTTEVVTATFYEQLIVLHSAAILSSILFAVLRPFWWTWLLALAVVGSPLLMASLPKFGIKIYTSIARKIGRDQAAHLPRPITVIRYVVLVHLYSIAWIINGLVLAGIYATFFQ
jgi:glycosyltransferase 2 family protein